MSLAFVAQPGLSRFAWALFLLLALAPTGQAKEPARTAEKPAEDQKTRYLRLVRDAKGTPSTMEVAIVRFKPRDAAKSSPTVDLVAAVHVAEPTYYRQLNQEFDSYDVVLYELVAPEGTKIPEGGVDPNRNPVSSIQNGMKEMLKLEFQLNAVRYNRPNMVHADMSPDQFAKSMADRGESLLTIFMRMLGYAMAKQTKDPHGGNDLSLLLALLDPNRSQALKRVLAEQFEDMEGSLMALEGPAGSTLISQRNRVAIDVLKQQIKAGKQKIAIFYGAGHMPNMEQRLRDELDLAPVSTRWLIAWDMRESAKAKAAPSGK